MSMTDSMAGADAACRQGHIAEDLLSQYVANGELITVALVAGYPMRHDHRPNALFAMSNRDINWLRTQQAQARRTSVGQHRQLDAGGTASDRHGDPR